MHRRPDIQLRDVPERSRRNQRDCDRQPGVERRDKHLLFDPRGGVCEWPEVQCIRRSRKSPLCGETDPVSSTVNQFRQCSSFLNEFPDRGVGFGQRFLVRQKYDAEVLRAWFLAEAGAVHDHDMFLADQFFHEDLIALGNVDARIGVERSARGNATDAGRRLAPFLGEIAARAQFSLNFEEGPVDLPEQCL